VKHVLFICSQNRLRSPTAEQVFSGYPGVECASAGLNRDADHPLTPELVEWAELIFVMEKAHLTNLTVLSHPRNGKSFIVVVMRHIPHPFSRHISP
jgi:predicted protein tyrosine phosphatase